MGNKAEMDNEKLERIADSLERLVIAADSIVNALSRRCKHDLRHEDCRECGVKK